MTQVEQSNSETYHQKKKKKVAYSFIVKKVFSSSLKKPCKKYTVATIFVTNIHSTT